jgi:glutamyl-tRNA reductase
LNLKKPLLILDLSIPKMYMLMLKEEGVTLIHMDYLSQLTDETLENRKTIFQLLAIIEEIKESLMFGQRKQICLQFML